MAEAFWFLTSIFLICSSESSIPDAPPLPDFELCHITPVARQRSATESSGSSTHSLPTAHYSGSSFAKRRNSHPIHDFTDRIQRKAKKILGKISRANNDEHEVLEYHVKTEQVLPIDQVEAEQTRNIIDAFLHEGQVTASTELEVLDEMEQASLLEIGGFDDARQEYAALVATASEAMHDFQDPAEIAEILSHNLEECLPTALNPVNELFINYFLAEHATAEALPVSSGSLQPAGVPETLEAGSLRNSVIMDQRINELNQESCSSKPSSPQFNRFNVESPYRRLRWNCLFSAIDSYVVY